MSDLIPVINHEARNYQLTAYKPDSRTPEELERLSTMYRGQAPASAREVEHLTLLPGLNFVSKELVEAARLNPDTSNVRVSFRNVADLPQFEAIELAKNTVSRQSLVLWRTQETRSQVVAAIDESLKVSK